MKVSADATDNRYHLPVKEKKEKENFTGVTSTIHPHFGIPSETQSCVCHALVTQTLLYCEIAG